MVNLTEKQRKVLSDLHKVGCTDSDLVELCENHQIPLREAYKYFAILNAPKQCQGCKHITMVSLISDYPCSVCSRICNDMYEQDEEDAQKGDKE